MEGGDSMSKKAIPISVQVAKGNPNRLTKSEIKRRQKNDENLKPNTNNIRPPTWLDTVALEEWERLSEELAELELLTNVDISLLAVYCDAYSRYLQATEALEREGMFVEYTNKGGATNVVEHPSVKAQIKYSELMRKIATEFGLTPASRAKIAIRQPDNEPKNKFMKYI